MLELLRNNQETAYMLDDICDVFIFSEFKEPKSTQGCLTFSIHGQAFAKDGAGGEYILFMDNSVGIYDSERQCGRIAESLEGFFVFMVNCPFWHDYIRKDYYTDTETLRSFASEIFKEHCEMSIEEMDVDLIDTQKSLAEQLEITLYQDTVDEVLMKFYRSATRAPQIIASFKESDGSLTSSSGTLFD